MILTGARGGQGTSTGAAVLALYAAVRVDTELVASEPAAIAALLGITFDGQTAHVTDRLTLTATPMAPPAVRIVDATHAEVEPFEAVVRRVVLRGPCYLALRTLVTASVPAEDGIVVVAELGPTSPSETSRTWRGADGGHRARQPGDRPDHRRPACSSLARSASTASHRWPAA